MIIAAEHEALHGNEDALTSKITKATDVLPSCRIMIAIPSGFDLSRFS
jgi:hypothetical protein